MQRKAVAWTLTTSPYFVRRKREAESHDFGDMEATIYAQQFDTDWARVASKERFVVMIGRSDKDLLATDRVELQRGALPCIALGRLLRQSNATRNALSNRRTPVNVPVPHGIVW